MGSNRFLFVLAAIAALAVAGCGGGGGGHLGRHERRTDGRRWVLRNAGSDCHTDADTHSDHRSAGDLGDGGRVHLGRGARRLYGDDRANPGAVDVPQLRKQHRHGVRFGRIAGGNGHDERHGERSRLAPCPARTC